MSTDIVALAARVRAVLNPAMLKDEKARAGVDSLLALADKELVVVFMKSAVVKKPLEEIIAYVTKFRECDCESLSAAIRRMVLTTLPIVRDLQKSRSATCSLSSEVSSSYQVPMMFGAGNNFAAVLADCWDRKNSFVVIEELRMMAEIQKRRLLSFLFETHRYPAKAILYSMQVESAFHGYRRTLEVLSAAERCANMPLSVPPQVEIKLQQSFNCWQEGLSCETSNGKNDMLRGIVGFIDLLQNEYSVSATDRKLG
jgi:hypothetical protein